MPVVTADITAQLRVLDRLLAVEAGSLNARSTQARTVATRRELTGLAGRVEQRQKRLRTVLRDTGGVPDAASRALAKLAGPTRAVLDQAQPISEGLFADLAVVRQVEDRAAYVRVLGRSVNNQTLRDLAQDIGADQADVAETLQRLLASLGEDPAELVARGGQVAAGLIVRVTEPATHAAARTFDKVADRLSQKKDRAVEAAESVTDVIATGRDAALERAEQLAGDSDLGPDAGSIHELRSDLGALNADELPIRGYDDLNANEAAAAIRALEDPDQLETMAAYELRNKNRSTVNGAVLTHRAALAAEDS